MSGVLFTDLPAEVRNAIYGYCTPLTGYMEDYRGLLLVSKQVRAEYEYEAMNTMSKIFNEIRTEWPHKLELRIKNPTKISEVSSIDVRLPASLYDPFIQANDLGEVPADDADPDRLEPCLAFLFYLHVSQLAIGYYYNFECYAVPDSRIPRRLIPYGLLTDLTSALIPQSEATRIFELSPSRKSRSFRLEKPIRIRRLRYQWATPIPSTSEFRVLVARANTTFFLREDWRRTGLNSLVRNWGSSISDTVFFDFNDQ